MEGLAAAAPYQLFVNPPVAGVKAVHIIVGPDAAFLGLLQLERQQVLHAELTEHRQRLQRRREGG